MEWARLVLDYIDSLAWPLVVAILVVFFALLFRKNIARLLDDMTSAAGPGGIRAYFGERAQALKERADEADLPPAPLRPSITAEEVVRADASYGGALLDSWVEVEHALIGVAEALEFGLGPNPGVASVIDELEKRKLVTVVTAEVIRSARGLRNDVAHAVKPVVDIVMAKTYVGIMRQVLAMLELVEKHPDTAQDFVKGKEDPGDE